MGIQNTAIKKTFFQFVRFCIVGFSNTFFSYGVYVLVLVFMRDYNRSWDYFIANIVSFLIGTLWAFFWGTKFVFRVRHRNIQEAARALLKSYTVYGMTGLLLCNVLSWIWIAKLEISRYLAPLLNLMVSVPINYFLNRFWTFKKSEQVKDSGSRIGRDAP